MSSDTAVTATTVADTKLAIGVALNAAGSGENVDVRLLGCGIFVMIAGGTVTRGTKVKVEGADGRVTDLGGSDDDALSVGRALKSTSTDGDLIPVLVLSYKGLLK